MRQLSFMGPSNDGLRLLLVSDDDGTEFELLVDDRLIAVVSREHGPRVSRPIVRQPTRAAPTPREIQDRIRHGASVDDVAASCGVKPEEIARYAHPVITERAHTAAKARTALVPFGGGQVELHSAVGERVRSRGIDDRLVRWDSWRTADGLWTVVAAYPIPQGERLATFAFNTADRSVQAVDDEARWLIEEAAEVTTPRAVASTADDSWGESHPAARAKRRRESEAPVETSSPSVRTLAPERPRVQHLTPQSASATQSSVRPLESPIPAVDAQPAQHATTTTRTPRVTTSANPKKGKAEEPAPQWEELLFGTPRDDDGNG